MQVSPVLEKIADTVKKNASKVPFSCRYDEVITKFSIALYILSGSMAYEFIHHNIPQALPCLRTVQKKKVQDRYKHIREGKNHPWQETAVILWIFIPQKQKVH